MTNWRERASLRPSEVAEVTGLSLATVRRMIARGELRAIRVGRSVIVRTEEVERIVAHPRSDARIEGMVRSIIRG